MNTTGDPRTVRQALLDAGLDMRTVKARLAEVGLAGGERVGSVADEILHALLGAHAPTVAAGYASAAAAAGSAPANGGASRAPSDVGAAHAPPAAGAAAAVGAAHAPLAAGAAAAVGAAHAPLAAGAAAAVGAAHAPLAAGAAPAVGAAHAPLAAGAAPAVGSAHAPLAAGAAPAVGAAHAPPAPSGDADRAAAWPAGEPESAGTRAGRLAAAGAAPASAPPPAASVVRGAHATTPATPAAASAAPPGSAAGVAAPPPTAADAPARALALARRLERVRLLLHRYALRHQPLEAMSLVLPSLQTGTQGALRTYLGLQAPPREALEELADVERALAQLDAPSVGAGEERLAAALGLGALERDLLWLVVAPEASPRFLWLLDTLAGTRTEGALPLQMLRHVFGDSPGVDAALGAAGPLLRYALLVEAGGGHYRAAARVVDLLLGDGEARTGELDGVARPVEPAPAPPLLPAVAEAAFAALRAEGVERLLATGPEGAGARAVALRLAADLAVAAGEPAPRPVLAIDLRALAVAGAETLAALAREARVAGAVLLLHHARVLEGDGYPLGERARLVEMLRREPIPLVVDGGVSESLELTFGFGVAVGLSHLALGLPLPEERAGLWSALLDGALAAASPPVDDDARDDLVQAVRAFPMGVDHMADAVELARLEGPPAAAPSPAALRKACDHLVTHRLGEFAVKVETRARWQDLIVPDEVGEQLADLILHARLSTHVLDELGYGKRLAYGRGLSALLSGPSGTGKTMAATLIAGELGVELYRVDLSNVVSKYIGETEQRLGSVFAEAAATGAALLFDEADSLFAKRTEVKSSTDRYANLEINFLLQKLEEHSGISLLTTNFAASIDKAFLRRIRFHIDFPEPDAEARELLWRTMIPDGAPIDPGIDFRAIAHRFSFAGGAIRNAVLRAAFRAAAEDRPLLQEDLERSARAESMAQGKLQWEPTVPEAEPTSGVGSAAWRAGQALSDDDEPPELE